MQDKPLLSGKDKDQSEIVDQTPPYKRNRQVSKLMINSLHFLQSVLQII